ncbi:M23 family peptidase [Kamptonema sp. UHCC 0994]|uniref:M23 family metallopeptidase n=1 Tax=Kamptonema sp. UHCC 0994 TaxID=3031329 RepID=UPI0023BA9C9D|nr:M23 family peptidase [Kamptonema sp. UHCC 0994]MDF0556565.1 M23 family peptidase [Kamptonema sp. UHCC 0994]
MFEFPVDTSSIVYSPETGDQHNPVSLDTAYRRGDFLIAIAVTGMAIAILAPGLNQILQNSVGVLVRGGQSKSQIANADNNTQPATVSQTTNAPTVSSNGPKTPPKFTGSWASSPLRSQNIAGFPVTSAYGPRTSPCAGCSSMHRGADIGTPMYTPLYAIGPLGSSVNVRCWSNGRWGWVASFSVPEWGVSFDYVHLPVGECKSGLQKVGTIIAKSGTAGTGPHLHFQQRIGGTDGEKIAPQTGYVYQTLTGKLPGGSQ